MIPDQIKSIIFHKGRIILNIKNTQYDVVKDVAQNDFNFKLTQNFDKTFGIFQQQYFIQQYFKQQYFKQQYFKRILQINTLNKYLIQILDILWTDFQVPLEIYLKLKTYQKINFFPGIEQICKKNLLTNNFDKMQKRMPNDYLFYPRTWILPIQYRQFKEDQTKNDKQMYILKPDSSCQGKGISLIKEDEIEDIKEEGYILQEYIYNPFLIENLKWDLRLYVLLAGTNPLRIFLYNEGMARFATVKYQIPDKNNYSNTYQHLTNYSINKNHPNFKFNNSNMNYGIGHKRSYSYILEYLKNKGHDTIILQEQIDQIIIKTIGSIQFSLMKLQQRLFPQNYSDDICFQILGFDILLDSNLKPWLLEVNQSPSLSTDTPFDLNLKRNLIKDTIQILKINSQHKRQYYRCQQIDDTYEKLYKKQSKNLKKKEIEQQIQYHEEVRDKWINNNLGNFRNLINDNSKEFLQKILSLDAQQNQNLIYKKFNQTSTIKSTLYQKIQQKQQDNLSLQNRQSIKQNNYIEKNKSNAFLTSRVFEKLDKSTSRFKTLNSPIQKKQEEVQINFPFDPYLNQYPKNQDSLQNKKQKNLSDIILEIKSYQQPEVEVQDQKLVSFKIQTQRNQQKFKKQLATKYSNSKDKFMKVNQASLHTNNQFSTECQINIFLMKRKLSQIKELDQKKTFFRYYSSLIEKNKKQTNFE